MYFNDNILVNCWLVQSKHTLCEDNLQTENHHLFGEMQPVFPKRFVRKCYETGEIQFTLEPDLTLTHTGDIQHEIFIRPCVSELTLATVTTTTTQKQQHRVSIACRDNIKTQAVFLPLMCFLSEKLKPKKSADASSCVAFTTEHYQCRA